MMYFPWCVPLEQIRLVRAPSSDKLFYELHHVKVGNEKLESILFDQKSLCKTCTKESETKIGTGLLHFTYMNHIP
jgi:hypothetical protein